MSLSTIPVHISIYQIKLITTEWLYAYHLRDTEIFTIVSMEFIQHDRDDDDGDDDHGHDAHICITINFHFPTAMTGWVTY